MDTYTRNVIRFEKDMPESVFEMICNRILAREEGTLFLDYNEIVPIPEQVRRVNALGDDALYTTKDPAVLLYEFIQAEKVSIQALGRF